MGTGKSPRKRSGTPWPTVDRYLNLLPTLLLKDDKDRRRHAEWWKREFGELLLSELTPAVIASARDRLLTTPMAKKSSKPDAVERYRQPATVVRYLATLSHLLTVAAEDWAWLMNNPVGRVRKPKLPPGRVRYLSESERRRLLAACRASTSVYLYPVVVVAIATGMRRSEILGLRWAQVDFDRGSVTLEHTNNGERRQLPLVGHALEVIRDLATAPHEPRDHVFPGVNPGRPRDITAAWGGAVARAGLVDFRFHDLRHTTASYLAMRDASLLEIGEVLGHKSPQMTKRYAHLSVAHTRKVLLGMVSEVLPADSPAPPGEKSTREKAGHGVKSASTLQQAGYTKRRAICL